MYGNRLKLSSSTIASHPGLASAYSSFQFLDLAHQVAAEAGDDPGKTGGELLISAIPIANAAEGECAHSS